MLALYQRLERQQTAESRRLRADLETVAVATQVSLTETRSQLGELVSYAAPARASATGLENLVPTQHSKGN
jgi:hypothetical protein